jgi:FtsP/CotA-like multicopper oxidase with cupredoxin domain
MISRRDAMKVGALAAGTLAAAKNANAAVTRPSPRAPGAPEQAPGQPHKDYLPVETLPVGSLPWKIVGNAKVFHLVAEPVKHEFAPGLEADCWGYNGSTPGPTIECVEGDRVRIYVTNKLPEPTTVHWHGLIVENGMDGVAGVTQKAIQPGETFRYEFVVRYAGTFMYHPHFDEMTQMALGMAGMFIVHPRKPTRTVDRDYVIMLSEWQLVPGTRRPNPMAMTEFNILTMNSKVFPATGTLVAKTGDRIRVRLGNLGAMDHHPIHLHGFSFAMTATDGGPVPESAQHPETTILVPVGTTRTIEWVADNPGDWPFHCHMTHHVMTQMGHDFPNVMGANVDGVDARMQKVLPGYMTMGQDGMGNMAEMGMPVPANSTPMRGGPGQFGYIDMGGMFTIVKVRDVVDETTASSWYPNPPGTVATIATAEELARDGIDPAHPPRRGGQDVRSTPVEELKKAPPQVTLYTCPMHPEVISKTRGKCPKCGMALVVKK